MTATRQAGLVAADFAPIALAGAGDSLNAYAHSASWFADELYVGTTRANLSLLKIHGADQLDPWPTPVPPDVYDQDLRAQVLAYDPRSGTWRLAFRSPCVTGSAGIVPREIGYRGMTVYQGSDDPAACLYVAGWASARSGRPPVLMRSRDGVGFDAVATIDTVDGTTSYRSFRPHGGWLYAAPTGRVGGSANVTGQGVVLATRRPSASSWDAANQNPLGVGGDLGVIELAALGADLYATTIDPSRGFSLWRCSPAGDPPHWWVQRLADGAGRGPLNEAGLSLCAFGGALYIGTAIQNGGFDRRHRIGPAAAEVLRVYPDGSWDLIVGEPRHTAQGYKRPLSGRGPGFDNPFNTYVWRMVVHEGRLYATTYNYAVFLPYLKIRRTALPGSTAGYLTRQAAGAAYGGFELWSTGEGVDWTPVMRGGFGTPYNYGGRTLVSTPHGLVVGTANPFGPEVAVPTGAGWSYVPNPRGGCELWLGGTA